MDDIIDEYLLLKLVELMGKYAIKKYEQQKKIKKKK